MGWGEKNKDDKVKVNIRTRGSAKEGMISAAWGRRDFRKC